MCQAHVGKTQLALPAALSGIGRNADAEKRLANALLTLETF